MQREKRRLASAGFCRFGNSLFGDLLHGGAKNHLIVLVGQRGLGLLQRHPLDLRDLALTGLDLGLVGLGEKIDHFF